MYSSRFKMHFCVFGRFNERSAEQVFDMSGGTMFTKITFSFHLLIFILMHILPTGHSSHINLSADTESLVITVVTANRRARH